MRPVQIQILKMGHIHQKPNECINMQNNTNEKAYFYLSIEDVLVLQIYRVYREKRFLINIYDKNRIYIYLINHFIIM